MDLGLKSYQTGCRNCVENTVQLSVFFFATFWILLLQKTTQDGANASMIVFSIVETAKANNLDSQKYLQFLLDQRPSAEMTDAELDQLVPWSDAARIACST